MSKHTPGPWKVVLSRVYRNKAIGVSPVLRHDSIMQSSAFGKDYSVGLANANLIAAAPDLLEAVKAMQAACAEWAAEFTQGKRAMNWGIVNDAYIKAERAIAAADEPTEPISTA